ncbi:MAG TPA: hypothetical protein PLU30_25070 [Verrucomicrobiae bacterium]|nr:hypothetical protein [Verrucomicrobiae bacterium]
MRSRASPLEAKFALLWRALRGPVLAREHRFAPPRRWRFDFAHLPSRVAVEIEGGVWRRGRHVRPKGFIADCEKYSAAALAGWTVVRLTARDINTRKVEEIIAAMNGREHE